MAMTTMMPAIVRTNPRMIKLRWAWRFANRSAPSDEARMPTAAAVKVTPVSTAL